MNQQITFVHKANLLQIMSQEENSSQSEGVLDRIQKKYKKDDIKVNIRCDTNINELAMKRYENIKSEYNFTTFEEADKSKTITTGKFEDHSIPLHDFNEEMYKFKKYGFCSNPDTTTKGLVFSSKNGKIKQKAELQGEVIGDQHPVFLEQLYQKTTSKNKKKMIEYHKNQRDKEDVLNYKGPWAGYGQNLQNGAITTEQKQQLVKAEELKKVRVEEAKEQQKNFQPYQIFHWKNHTDYRGLSYLQPPADMKVNNETCYIPKKEVHSWVGSRKEGYQCVRFFPKSGHFFLLGNPQGKVLLFDVIKSRTIAHTYVGHTKAIRDIQFTNDGKHFMSSSFDNNIQYWDTEYGKVLRTFKMKKIPFAIRFHPNSAMQNMIFVGSGSKKIYQFDLNTSTKVLEYNQHLGAVNTLTFIEQNKFISTSDDKKIFIWQYGIPVVTRHVSEPEMHAITATALHPSGEFFAGQSGDNQIVIYENKGGNFRRIRSKKFDRHFCAGYACSIDFSYDGQYLMSGDQRGKIYFYDWKKSTSYRVLDGHAGASIGLQWHPNRPTTVLSAGWQGMVKLWQ